uniref:Ubiquitin-like protease family profile domain-containing protein n=1 Tax=Setaria italica TaxID=4555 RepID=K3XPW6_SETIT
MSYFVACMSYDECHMADGGICQYEDENFSQWESHQARAVLQRDIGDLDPTKVKLWFLPVMEEEHYSIYCINFIHERIDVLDSSPKESKASYYHQVLGDQIIRRLNLLFQLVTKFEMKQFTIFKRPIIDVCMHTDDNDCGFFAIKFMELWNGDSFHVPILTENVRQYRSQLPFYGLYHRINEIKKLPAGLEAHRRRM